MSDQKFLKLGPESPYDTEKRAYIALSDHQTRFQVSGEFLVGQEHSSLASLEAEVEQIRRDLDDILESARRRFKV